MKLNKSIFLLVPLIFLVVSGSCLPVNAYTPKQIYQKAGPGVVFIFASKGSSKGSGGTGSIISRDGLVITNAHIFAPKGSAELLTDISIFLKPPKVTGNQKTDLANGYRGKIIAYDIPLDLALVKIMNPDRKLTTVPFADSETVEIGDTVYAIGHPEQGGLWSLTSGVISAFWSNYGGIPGKNLFQTDASINRGNSGGPLLDEYGTMIGINSMIARKAADGLTITDVNFSIRSQVAIDWLNQQGYRIAAVRHTDAAPEKMIAAVPKKPEKKVAPSAAEPENEITTAPPVTQKTQAPAQQPPKAASEKEVADNQPQAPKPKKETLSSPPAEQKQAPSSETLLSEAPKEGKILTEKKPYHMDELLEGMREMEDLMDEMKGMMDEFRERRKQ